MEDSNERLRDARKRAGFKSARKAAQRHGWVISTYASHENGQTAVPQDAATAYAKAYGVTPEWILFAKKPGKPISSSRPKIVPLVGYVAAGAETIFTPAGELGEVDAPEGATAATVAVEIRGDSLGALFDRWLVFYDDVRRPVERNSDLIGRLCVIGLEDGRIVIKKLRNSRTKGLFHLISGNNDPPITDVAIEWAARVRNMVPR